MKKILVLLTLIIFFLFIGITFSQECKIIPMNFFVPDKIEREIFVCRGTWMIEGRPYDPKYPNISYITCSKLEKNCHVASGYIAPGNILDVLELDYTINLWNESIIVAATQGLYGTVTLTIRPKDKLVVLDKPSAPREILKEGSPLYNNSLQEFYYGKTKGK
jgi:hypothetical protein